MRYALVENWDVESSTGDIVTVVQWLGDPNDFPVPEGMILVHIGNQRCQDGWRINHGNPVNPSPLEDAPMVMPRLH